MGRSFLLRGDGLFGNKDPGTSRKKDCENQSSRKGKGFSALIISRELVGT